MNEILEMIIDSFFEHWTKVAVGAVLVGAGWVVGWYRAQTLISMAAKMKQQPHQFLRVELVL